MKKWLAALLAVMLLALPLSGLAESPDELMEKALDAGLTLESQITLTPGDLPFGEDINTPVSDMLSALGIYQLSSREGRNAFALQLSGKDAFRVDWESTEDRFYLSSNWLGEDAISFNEEELAAFITRLSELAGSAADITAEELEKAFASMNTQPTGFSEEDIAKVTAYLEALMERVETSEVTQQPRNCDPAEQVLTLTLTAEDIAQYYEIVFDIMLENEELMNFLHQLNFTATVDGEAMTVEEAMEQFPDKIRAQADAIGEIPLSLYVDSNGELVMMTMDMNITSQASTAVAMNFELTRQTTNDGIGWAANMDISENDVPLAGLTASYLMDSQTMDVFTLVVVAKQEGADDVEMLNISYLADKDYAADTAKNTTTLSFSFRPEVDQEPLALTLESITEAAFDGTDASLNNTAKLFLTGEEEPILTKTRTVTSVEAPASLAEGETVTPGTMDDTAFQTFLNRELATLSASVTKMLQLLPASVLQVLLPAISMM